MAAEQQAPPLLPTGSHPPNFWGDMPEEEYYASLCITNTKSYFSTPNGKIFTQSFIPTHLPIKASVYMTHGYSFDSTWCFQKICLNFASWGYVVFTADLLSYGRSDGLRGYLGDFDKFVATSLSFFLFVRRNKTYNQLSAFLFKESMDGDLTMLMYFQSEPDTWTGLIFSAPLFVIPKGMIPSNVCS